MKNVKLMTNTTVASKYIHTYLRGPEFASIEIPPFTPQFMIFSFKLNLTSQRVHLEVLLVWKISIYADSGLLGSYFDAAVVNK